jgi:hypothetical protein
MEPIDEETNRRNLRIKHLDLYDDTEDGDDKKKKKVIIP